MEHRQLGSTTLKVSSIGFGAWAIGGSWGEVSEDSAVAALHTALDAGTNFFDTADVYGDGRSERLLARLRRERSEPFYVATKAGRRLPTQTVEGYSSANLRGWVERSLQNLESETLDLLQLHCPPSDLYKRNDVFEMLEDLKKEGLIRHYGVSVEKVSEAQGALERGGVEVVQIIFNLFRFKPTEEFFAAAKAKNVGIIARVPMASGLLTGKITRDTQFAPDDHRNFNRHGESFDVGETFSGVDFEAALAAVEELKPLVPAGMTLAQFALRWILMFPEVSCAIPGAKTPEQAWQNASSADFPALSDTVMNKARAIYNARIRNLVQDRW